MKFGRGAVSGTEFHSPFCLRPACLLLSRSLWTPGSDLVRFADHCGRRHLGSSWVSVETGGNLMLCVWQRLSLAIYVRRSFQEDMCPPWRKRNEESVLQDGAVHSIVLLHFVLCFLPHVPGPATPRNRDCAASVGPMAHNPALRPGRLSSPQSAQGSESEEEG